MILITEQAVGTRILWRQESEPYEIIEGEIIEFSLDKTYVHIKGILRDGWEEVEMIVVLAILDKKQDNSKTNEQEKK